MIRAESKEKKGQQKKKGGGFGTAGLENPTGKHTARKRFRNTVELMKWERRRETRCHKKKSVEEEGQVCEGGGFLVGSVLPIRSTISLVPRGIINKRVHIARSSSLILLSKTDVWEGRSELVCTYYTAAAMPGCCIYDDKLKV